jgi:hypothetical protein
VQRWPLLRALERCSRIVQLGRAFVRNRFHPESTLSGEGRQEAPYSLWSMVRQVSLELRSDPEQFRRVQEHYAFTIGSMLGEAERAGVPAFVLTVPSNLRDWTPNVSHQTLEGEALERWTELRRTGLAALRSGAAEEAVAMLQRVRDQ